MSRLLKIVLLLAAFTITVVLSQKSLAAGFSKGNDFKVNRIGGQVSIQCPASNGGIGYQTKYTSCSADLWTPGLTDYFVGPQVDANKVELTATREDGSTRTKDADYDGAAGKSKKAFNLGIWTLTQKPLLKDGRNEVAFTLSKDGTTVEQGNFTANVVRGPSYSCHFESYYSGSSFDCDSPQFVCDQYFEDQNYCQP